MLCRVVQLSGGFHVLLENTCPGPWLDPVIDPTISASAGCPIMINWAGLVGERGCPVSEELLGGHREIAHLSGTAGGVSHAVAFASAVAQNLPGFHAPQGVFDAGTNSFVDGVEIVFPVRQRAAVDGDVKGHDHLGLRVTEHGRDDC
jgi:hypothetical protein